MKLEDCVWPERLRIRDTGLHDDMGGGGQRIYTTAGRGYPTREYALVPLPPDAPTEQELLERTLGVRT